jgi:hypothetical protein
MQRDTPPAIALYSVLVGGIPSRPPVPSDNPSDDIEAQNDSDRLNLDWQLSVTSAFFDHCIPNQPGFSSSVAAVTILPKASELASAWRKWYAAAKKLRRLRFIRKQIRSRRHYDIEVESVDEDNGDGGNKRPSEDCPPTLLQFTSTRSIYNDNNAAPRADYNREVLGSAFDEEVEDLFLEALDFGPEQTAVYSREFAQSAAPCCPNGCFEEALLDATIDELLDLEQFALEEVQAANKALEAARSRAVTNPRSTKELERKTPAREPRPQKISPSKDDEMEKEASKKKRGHHKLRSFGHGELPVDFGAVKNLLGNDTVKSLMGKDSSVPTDACKAGQTGSSSVSGRVRNGSGDFLMESKLLEHRNTSMTQLGSNNGKTKRGPQIANAPNRPDVVRKSKSDECDKSEGKDKNSSPRNWHHRRSRTEAGEFEIPIEFGDKPKVWDAELPLHDSSEILHLNDSGTEWNEPIHPLMQNRAQASEPALGSNREPSLSQDHRHMFSEPSMPVGTILPSQFTANYQKSASVRNGRTANYDPSDPWALVDALAHDSQEQQACDTAESGFRVLSTGTWELSSVTKLFGRAFTSLMQVLRWTSVQSNKAVVDVIAGDSTYGVVTFTSRQAAVAARKVLADGRASDRWIQIDTLPIPPLADAAPCDFLTCRGCCRPVTLTINDRSKKWRFYL